MLFEVILFCIGVVLGGLIAVRFIRMKKVGALVIDVVDPFNDQPFLLELQTDVNVVYQKKYIVLQVIKKHI